MMKKKLADIGVSQSMMEEYLGISISDTKWREIIQECQDDCVAASTNIIEEYLDN